MSDACDFCNTMRIRVMQLEKVAQAAAIELRRIYDTVGERELDQSDETALQRIADWIDQNTNPSEAPPCTTP